MKQQQGYPWAEIPILDLQPLHFEPVPNGNGVVTYQALIKIAPAMPEFSVTVKAASPSEDPQAGRELQSLLDNMRGRFLLIDLGPDEGPDEGPDDDPESESFDPGTEILILLGLTEPGAIKETFGVIMVLQTAVEGGTEAEADPAALARARSAYGTVPKGRDHKYTASSPMWATVTSIAGSGSVRSPVSAVPAGGSGYAYGKAVFVHGYTYMKFTISAGWKNKGLT